MAEHVFYHGAKRAVHHAEIECQAKNRYLVTTNWKKVSCSFCLKKQTPKPKEPLPKGIKDALKECRCKECWACRSRSQRS